MPCITFRAKHFRQPWRGILCVGIGYLGRFEDAQKRLRRGERQARCSSCGCWLWAGEEHTCADGEYAKSAIAARVATKGRRP